MKRTPLKRSKGLNPRRKRAKMHKRGLEANAAERRHLDRVAMRCVVTSLSNEQANIVVHHVMKCPGKRTRRDHRYVIGLLPELHNMGPRSIHELGSEALFEEVHGLPAGYIADTAIRLWEASQAIERAA